MRYGAQSLKTVICAAALSLLMVPYFVSAQFTSTNYLIDSYIIGETGGEYATSSNYIGEVGGGQVYIYVAGTSTSSGGGGGGGSSDPDPDPPPPDPDPEPDPDPDPPPDPDPDPDPPPPDPDPDPEPDPEPEGETGDSGSSSQGSSGGGGGGERIELTETDDDDSSSAIEKIGDTIGTVVTNVASGVGNFFKNIWPFGGSTDEGEEEVADEPVIERFVEKVRESRVWHPLTWGFRVQWIGFGFLAAVLLIVVIIVSRERERAKERVHPIEMHVPDQKE